MRTRVTTAALSAMLVLALAGCTTPEPPEPTPTPAFASEEEAFAAAEATYRAYVDALNQLHAGADATPAPTDYLIGTALEAELVTQRTLEEMHRSLVGTAVVASFTATSLSTDHTEIEAVVCLDVSDSRVIDADGDDVTPSERPSVLALEIGFVQTGGELAVASSKVADHQTC